MNADDYNRRVSAKIADLMKRVDDLAEQDKRLTYELAVEAVFARAIAELLVVREIEHCKHLTVLTGTKICAGCGVEVVMGAPASEIEIKG